MIGAKPLGLPSGIALYDIVCMIIIAELSYYYDSRLGYSWSGPPRHELARWWLSELLGNIYVNISIANVKQHTTRYPNQDTVNIKHSYLKIVSLMAFIVGAFLYYCPNVILVAVSDKSQTSSSYLS